MVELFLGQNLSIVEMLPPQIVGRGFLSVGFHPPPVAQLRGQLMQFSAPKISTSISLKEIPVRKYLTVLMLSITTVTAAATPASLTLSGKFTYSTDEMSQEMTGDAVCFYPDKAGQSAVLGYLKTSARRYGHDVWFCFDNSATAAKQLGFKLGPTKGSCGVTGVATVVITKYSHYAEEGDGNDTATFVSVT